MPLKFWDEAFLTATYLINILPSKVTGYNAPVELLLLEEPDYGSLRIFGCACWLNLRPYNTRKLAFRSIQCVFLGYSCLHKGFKCLEPSSGRVYISRDVVFDETMFPFSEMHPNAGARLRQEIPLLPQHLLNSGDALHGPDVTNHQPSASSWSVLQYTKKIWDKTMIKWCKTHAMAACFYSILLALGSKLIWRQQGAPDPRSIWWPAQMLLNARRVGRHDQLRPRPDPLRLLPRRSLSPRCLPLRAEETTLESKQIW
jgi:hypothetical protein